MSEGLSERAVLHRIAVSHLQINMHFCICQNGKRTGKDDYLPLNVSAQV